MVRGATGERCTAMTRAPARAARAGRAAVTLAVIAAVGACHSDAAVKAPNADSAAAAAAAAADTTPVDLSKVKTAIPAAAPDTFTPPKPEKAAPEIPNYPPAPPPLMASVNREQAFSRFCFEEFGQKLDPTLRGGVAMLVTVGDGGVTDARVANSRWSSKGPGDAVNGCLNEKAKLAWKLEPGEIKSGQYVVQLSFRGN
jgi:hypothetical protein